jgi:sulfur-oxidizing protein SoxX
MMKKHLILVAFAAALASPTSAQDVKLDPLHADVLMKFAFSQAPKDWAGRVEQDETMKVCSAKRNAPSAAEGDKIMAAAKATIKYPDDGKLMGDWKKGEQWAQSGYGMRFTDYPPRNQTGGNCYACHQMTQAELSYGTVGPSLREYGKIRKYTEADVKAVYDKIYNAHASFPCSLMPRFGTNAVLTIDQIKDLVALVMSPESPVNK